MSKFLRILLWNANGVRSRIDELELVLNNEKIDICLLAETHLTNESNIKFKNYDFYHTIHPSNCARGGSAIAVRTSIRHDEGNHIR